MNKPLKIKLTILTPVHIGCDDVYEPTNFLIENDKLIHFDSYSFINTLNDIQRSKFIEICSKGTIASLLEVYKFVRNIKISGRQINIAEELKSHYDKVLNLPLRDENKIKQELNYFSISRTAYITNDNLPYIPGSSLKGSMRTAYLSSLAKEKGIKNYNGRPKDLEAELLGGRFSEDPFRFIKISDLMPVNNVRTKIYYALNVRKTGNKARGPYQILETIQQGSIFEGVINIETPTYRHMNSITVDNLKKAIKSFYRSIMEGELEVFRAFNLNLELIKNLRTLKENSFLIKIGRHSGAEAVTIEGNRKITIRGPRGQNKIADSSTTIWFASESKELKEGANLLPFGWAKIDFSELDEKNVYPKKIDINNNFTIPVNEQNKINHG